MLDNISVVGFLMKQKQEQLQSEARSSWMLAVGSENSIMENKRN